MRLAGCAADGLNLYDRIISAENLFLAFYEFRQGKRHKEDVPEFEYNLEKNIFQLRRELRKFTYEPLAPKVFKVTEPKSRFIQAARVRDRIVHRALVRQINPIFEPTFIYDSYACRIDKGTLNAVKRLERFWIKESKNYTRKIYFLKGDIRKYFDSINHEVLIAVIKKRISCPKTIWLIKKILKSQQTSCKGIKIEQGKGLPIGNLSSQLFANVYLNELDGFAKHSLKVKLYIRYVDDFIIVSKDRAYLDSLIEPIEDFLEEYLKLDLHPVKRKIFSSCSGVDFLGYFIRPYYKTIRFGNIKRLLRRIDRYKRIGKWQEKKEQSLAAWMGYAKQADSYNLLRKLNQTLISSIVCFLCFTFSCFAYDIEPYQKQYLSRYSSVLNLVFCPFGYQDKKDFLRDINGLIRRLKKTKPFDEINAIGFWYINTSKAEEDTIFKPTQSFPPIKLQSAFVNGVLTRLNHNYKLVIIDAEGSVSCAELSLPDKLSLIILGKARFKDEVSFSKGFLHELGHSLGLRDECVDCNQLTPAGEPNCARNKEEAQKWWGDLMGKLPEVNYIRGCCGNKNYIRPTIASLMNNPDKAEDFGPVNEQYLRRVRH